MQGMYNEFLVVEDHENFQYTPPTFFEKNDLTFFFQEIVNTLGVPRYKEVNPAVFAIVTFPFQFGIMFGDIGHGLICFVLGIFMLSNYEKFKDISFLKQACKFR